ncbi:Zn-dependent aspartyl aminopeptidase [Klebsormidium nitens]|uniref:aspartyl aminopeptidase n=1 Tax=Klebsormidium nitens TaxID=105231 RepID=A0A1Y1HZQ4_KLENI|nr:Zn-dependent aspartyl aminopeptidase [Klebsormidium nitens]|eukprot:GAQ83212.1 Zn-dependent aspartyl aminopeptidase [Klebsormidium nitens]
MQAGAMGEPTGSDGAKGDIAQDLVDYLNASWTSFHATAVSKEMLVKAGFEQLSEEAEWVVKPGGKYFFTRNASAVIAFTVGGAYKAGNGFNIIAAHTDSPCPKLKPVSLSSKHGFLNVGVQTYGGGLWYTWFDRDLSVAGRVLLRRKDGRLSHELVQVSRPIMRIPTLAIHLDRNVNTEGFKPNLETHLAPVLATAIKAEVDGKKDEAGGKKDDGGKKNAHHPLLLQILADELKVDPEEIADFDLHVCDTQPSVIAGARKEFIYSGRLDNLASSYCALRALIDTVADGEWLAQEKSVQMVALFDNEEVGSDSAQGAGSPTMFQAMKRVATLLAGSERAEGVEWRAIRRSFLVSADMAHALHPNYPERHEEHHQPKMHEGLVIKHNANQRYATTAVTAFLFRELAKREGIPTQDFVVRNDMGCGSTIGPILSSGVGIRTIDVGMPQLSMHSVREMCGTKDVDICYRHFKAFYRKFTELDEQLKVEK